MKTRIKVLILATVLLLALPVVAWTGTFLYWHFRITGAIQDMEIHPGHAGFDGNPHPAVHTLSSAGCRSMPYLIRALETSNSPTVLDEASSALRWHVEDTDPAPDEEFTAALKRIVWMKAEELASTRPRFAEWWERNRSKHNPWWRVWSGRCR